jgi:hypothetical protein
VRSLQELLGESKREVQALQTGLADMAADLAAANKDRHRQQVGAGGWRLPGAGWGATLVPGALGAGQRAPPVLYQCSASALPACALLPCRWGWQVTHRVTKGGRLCVKATGSWRPPAAPAGGLSLRCPPSPQAAIAALEQRVEQQRLAGKAASAIQQQQYQGQLAAVQQAVAAEVRACAPPLSL